MLSVKRSIFVVRKNWLIAISFIRGRHHNLLNLWTAPASLEKGPCAFHVGFKGGHRVPVRYGHNGLRCEVDNSVNFIFTQNAFQCHLVCNISANGNNVIDITTSNQLALRDPISYEADNLCL